MPFARLSCRKRRRRRELACEGRDASGYRHRVLIPEVMYMKLIAVSISTFIAYKMEQARISRRRLCPVTVFYGLYSVAVAIVVCRSRHAMVGIPFYLLGIAVWTLVEYLFHRYVLH